MHAAVKSLDSRHLKLLSNRQPKVQTRNPISLLFSPLYALSTSDKLVASPFRPQFFFFTVQRQSQARGELRGAAAIHTNVIMVTAPSFILPFKTQPALFTAAISISRLTARTLIFRAAATPLAVSSCQARQ